MARNSVSAEELVTMQQIAAMLSVSYWMVRAWRSGAESSRVPFPEPFTSIGRRPLWRRETITKWHDARK